MINKRVETFLEHNNMNYMFCLLSNLEVLRINSLPSYIKQKFDRKITEIAMEHVAQNEVPDYLMDIEEAKLEMERLGLTPEEFESGGRRDRFDDEDDFDLEAENEEFQGAYVPTYTEKNFDDDEEEAEFADADDED
jgi:hypothetical protein